ncbi:MAG TPA: GAF domain-containing protein [Candidatus Dormibacteraeota bacterium]|nr:GAF domain-containing protein [Candidatus Dormibacteraeota bacterium]
MPPAERRPRLDRRAVEALQAVALRAETARRLELGTGEAVLRSVVEAAVALFQSEAASIALYDARTDRLVFRVAAGAQGQGVIGLSIAPDQGLVGYVFTSGQALALSDVQRDPRFGRSFAQQTQYVPRSIVAVPLVDEQGTIGVLEVLDKRDASAFTLRDIELAGVFAGQAAVAIRATRVERESSALFESIVRLALGADGDERAIESIVSASVGELGREDVARLWPLVEQVARLRRADPEQLALVSDLLGVLADHAERRRSTRRGPLRAR